MAGELEILGEVQQICQTLSLFFVFSGGIPDGVDLVTRSVARLAGHGANQYARIDHHFGPVTIDRANYRWAER
jgi:hypothetical protein